MSCPLPQSQFLRLLPLKLFHPGSLRMQVLPDVLHVCELGLCGADAAEDAQLEAALSILPLVGGPSPPLPTGPQSYHFLAPPQVVEQDAPSSPAFVSG